jgi:hypothetical protein
MPVFTRIEVTMSKRRHVHECGFGREGELRLSDFLQISIQGEHYSHYSD